VPLAGPFTDGSGSMIVLEADSLGDAWAIVARDPFVVNGIYNRVELKPFLKVFPASQ
jgi:hypothetical protein